MQVNGLSIREHANGARVGLGLCPQFTAIDSQLTVREHLEVYGRLKGLRGRELDQNVATLLRMAELAHYRDRLASKLSGGNQRKMALAIALMGESTNGNDLVWMDWLITMNRQPKRNSDRRVLDWY